MISHSLRSVPLGEIPLGCEQLGIENRRARGTANRVMTERYKAIVKDPIASDAANGNAHPSARIPVKPWLGTVGFVSHDNWTLRG